MYRERFQRACSVQRGDILYACRHGISRKPWVTFFSHIYTLRWCTRLRNNRLGTRAAERELAARISGVTKFNWGVLAVSYRRQIGKLCISHQSTVPNLSL